MTRDEAPRLTAKDLEKAIEKLKKNGVGQNGCQVVLDANMVYQIMLENERLRRKPDPDTGIMRCGCGWKVRVECYPEWAGMSKAYQVDCFNCHVGTMPCQTAEQAKIAWDRAMGWRAEE